jgi:tRNA (guanine10-N2)-dimethyltransferase
MNHLYLLAGENLKLAKAELNAFLKSQKIEEKGEFNGRLGETDSEPEQLKRLALTQEICKKICEAENVQKIKTSYRPEGRFAVKAKNLTDQNRDTEALEKELGKLLETESNTVDLEKPRHVVMAYMTKNRIFIGELIENIERGLFQERSNQNRPFSSPISLDPVLARALVNLSGVRPGEHVLDPFCGTGGILIEAGLCGVGVHGLDVKDEMVSGSERNLEEYGIINHDIRQGEVSRIDEVFQRDFDAIVTDLPYGKSSKAAGNPVEEFLEFIEDFEETVVFVWNEEELNGYTADFSVYVHGSLTRYIFVLE